jgi:hypothetical protein
MFFVRQNDDRRENAMSVEELSSFRGIGGDRMNRTAHPDDHEPFQQGYVAGWQSVRGADEQPVLIPPSPVLVGPAMYMIGFSRGARDAGT